MKTISAGSVLFNNNWRIRNTEQRQAYFIEFRIKCSFLDARSPLCFLVCVRFQVTKTGKKKKKKQWNQEGTSFFGTEFIVEFISEGLRWHVSFDDPNVQLYLLFSYTAKDWSFGNIVVILIQSSNEGRYTEGVYSKRMVAGSGRRDQFPSCELSKISLRGPKNLFPVKSQVWIRGTAIRRERAPLRLNCAWEYSLWPLPANIPLVLADLMKYRFSKEHVSKLGGLCAIFLPNVS